MEKLRRKIPFILLCLHITLTAANDLTLDMDVEYYCFDRGENELFRRNLDNSTRREIRNNCPLFFRCTPAAIAGEQTISMTRCLQGLYFDVERQICDITREVKNCDQWDKTKPPRPFWPLREGETSRCEGDKIQCGSGECIVRDLFCDDSPDCQDGSDENICNPGEDPNGAIRCPLKGDICSTDGTGIPGRMSVNTVPQMINIAFTGAMTQEAVAIYDEIFTHGFKNKGNQCTAKGTFFVSHPFSNYSAIQELDRKGHEIALNSVTNNPDPNYWNNLTTFGYEEEFSGQLAMLDRFANLTSLIDTGFGLKVPQLRLGGNPQYNAFEYLGALYDNSIAAPYSKIPLWPYSLEYLMPHKCIGINQKCPSKNYTLIEMVMNELDRTYNQQDSKETGCHFLDSCNINDADLFIEILNNNLNRHYTTNRAPFGIQFTASYFLTRKKHLRKFISWVQEKSQLTDHYFVTMKQTVDWFIQPTEIPKLGDLYSWNDKCEPDDVPFCSIPNPCSHRVGRLFPREEKMFLYTCSECPPQYPWIDDPFGQGTNEILK